MREVSEEIRKALDDMPVHTQQLFHMFHKHRVKMEGNTTDFLDADRQTLAIAESIGWRSDGPLPNDVLNTPKGKRPPPEDYLTQEYMQEWRHSFDDGVTRLQPSDTYASRGPFRDEGPADWNNQTPGDHTSFVLPKGEVDDVLQRNNYDPRGIEADLGLPNNMWGDGEVTQIEFPNASSSDVQFPTGNETGANSDWLPGGRGPGGGFEGVLNGTQPSGSGHHAGRTFGGSQ